MNKILALMTVVLVVLVISCGGEQKTADQSQSDEKASGQANTVPDASANNPNHGIGKFTRVEVGALDAAMADKGRGAFDVKCASCHKTTDEKLVGPGWKGITARHAPEWIMNFLTNKDEMPNKDPKSKAELEICLVRMPNQNLNDYEARSLLEFMRQNDGAK